MNARHTNFVVVVAASVTRENGGAATLLDFAAAARSLGYDCTLLLTADSRIATALSSRRHHSPVPLRQLMAVSLSPLEPRCNGRRRSIKGWLRAVETRVLRRKIGRMLGSATIIIDGTGGRAGALFSQWEVEPSRLVLNHNGSVLAMREFFMRDLGNGDDEWGEAYRAVLADYRVVIVQSEDVAQQVGEHLASWQECIVLRPSSNEPAMLAAKRGASPFDSTRWNVVVVGSVQPRKNQIDAVSAISRMSPDVELHLVGPVWDEQYLLAIGSAARALGVEHRVHLLGMRSDYARFIAHASVLLQTSTAEGVSRVLREAMVAATPIIAYSIAGTSELFEDEAGAILVPAGDVDGLAAGLQRLYEDEDCRRDLGGAGQIAYLQTNSWSQYLMAVDGLIHRFGEASTMAEGSKQSAE